jgi:hypothetical protein
VDRSAKHWCFVDLEQEFLPVKGEVVWFKIRKIGADENVEICMKGMRQNTKFCVTSAEKRLSSFAPQMKGIRQGFGLTACFFNIFE